MVRGADGGGSRRLCKEQATRLAPKLRGDVFGGREVNRRLPGLLWQAPIAANTSDFGAQPEPGLLSDEPVELLGALARVLDPLRGGCACTPVSVAILALVRPHEPPKLAVGVEGEIQLLLLLLLLTPNKILKKTENRVLLSVSEWGPSTVGRTRKKKN